MAWCTAPLIDCIIMWVLSKKLDDKNFISRQVCLGFHCSGCRVRYVVKFFFVFKHGASSVYCGMDSRNLYLIFYRHHVNTKHFNGSAVETIFWQLKYIVGEQLTATMYETAKTSHSLNSTHMGHVPPKMNIMTLPCLFVTFSYRKYIILYILCMHLVFCYFFY